MKATSHGITLKAVHQPEHNCNGCHFDFPDRCAKATPSTRTMYDLAEAVKAAEFMTGKSCNSHPIIWVKE